MEAATLLFAVVAALARRSGRRRGRGRCGRRRGCGPARPGGGRWAVPDWIISTARGVRAGSWAAAMSSQTPTVTWSWHDLRVATACSTKARIFA